MTGSNRGTDENATGSNSAVERGDGPTDPADQVSTTEDDQKGGGDVDRDALGNEDGAS